MTDNKKFDDDERVREFSNFSLSDALAKEARGMFKDASLVPVETQARLKVMHFVRQYMPDTYGCLYQVLDRRLQANESTLSKNISNPLIALKEILSAITSSEYQLVEFVREVDQLYGQQFDERPYFQSIGKPAHPNDPYTHDSVRKLLVELAGQIDANK